MSAEIIKLVDHRPTDPIAEFTLAYNGEGKPILCLTWAKSDFIDSYSTLSERFYALKGLVIEGAEFLDECGKDFAEDQPE